MDTDLSRYLEDRAWPAARARRMVDGLRLLQELAGAGDRPVTYGEFAELVQPGLAPLASSRVLDDIGTFCAAAGRPNVTCFVVSARTGEPSPGCRHIGPGGAAAARELATAGFRELSKRSPGRRTARPDIEVGDRGRVPAELLRRLHDPTN